MITTAESPIENKYENQWKWKLELHAIMSGVEAIITACWSPEPLCYVWP